MNAILSLHSEDSDISSTICLLPALLQEKPRRDYTFAVLLLPLHFQENPTLFLSNS